MSVYFIRPVGMAGPVKIGHSSNPEYRLTSIAATLPWELEIVALLPGDADLERRFHAVFLSDHMRGEWFNWSPRLEAVIVSINAGALDIAALPQPQRLAASVKRRPWTDEQRNAVRERNAELRVKYGPRRNKRRPTQVAA